MQIPSLQRVIKRGICMMCFNFMEYFYYSIQQTIIQKWKKASNALKLFRERPEIIESTKFAVRVGNINITSTSYSWGLKSL